ncbi:hypothetical protein [Nonomuraea sp. NPDC050540]|uniref:hypothetical protein n=1 Tax=Nonomuraea sp. NPDC050540 TaxID=3364367 RepID=UPI0037B5D5C8
MDVAGPGAGGPVTVFADSGAADGGATWTGRPIEVDVPGGGRGVVVTGKPVRHRGAWPLPCSERAGAGVLRSSDLRTWRRGGPAVPPRGILVGEPRVERAHAAHRADGAARLEWSLVTATIGSQPSPRPAAPGWPRR